MKKSSIRSTLLAVLGALALGACASSGPPSHPTTAAPGRDADQLALAALRAWAQTKTPTEAANLAAQATKVAPQRAELAWLQLRICMETPRCDAQPLAARLKKLAPDNGAVWLNALVLAQSERDARSEEQVLAALSAAPHLNVYWTTLVWRLATALNTSAPPATTETAAKAPLTVALNDVTVWLSRLMLPTFTPLNSACDAARVRQPMRRATCGRLAAMLQASDSYAAEGLGLGIEQRSAPIESATDVEQRIATLAYQNQAAAAVMTAQLERDKFSAEIIELMQKLSREQDVSLAILRWADQPLAP